MPQLRQDLVTGRWVSIATERAKRPNSFTRAAAVAVPAGAQCPFCPGHESMTPPEVMAYRAPGTNPNSPGWDIRVVPNLYPAFGPANGEATVGHDGPYETMNGVGVHEVLVTSPDHYADIAELSSAQAALVVQSYVDRYNANKDNPAVQYLLIINNHGKEAGASLEHPHSQLFGIPVVPTAVQEELDGVRRYRAQHDSCPFCDVVAYERTAGERVVFENDAFLVYAPFASRTPFELNVLPRQHRGRFEEMSAAEHAAFAQALQQATGRVSKGLNNPPYNFYVHTAPIRATSSDDYHWHLELLPKLAIAAGFELGTGLMINVATPESAAEFLRGIDLAAAPETVVAPGLH